MAFVAVSGFVLLLVVAYLIARPLIAPTSEAEERSRSALEDEKSRLFDTIRDLDLDFTTGKLAEDDYRKLRARSLAEAAEVMRAIDEARRVEAAGRPYADEEPASSPESLDADLELEIAARREAMRQRAPATEAR